MFSAPLARTESFERPYFRDADLSGNTFTVFSRKLVGYPEIVATNDTLAIKGFLASTKKLFRGTNALGHYFFVAVLSPMNKDVAYE